MKSLVVGLLSIVLCGAGCSGLMGFPTEFQQVSKMVVDKVADQGVLEKWASNMNAHVNDPGIEAGVVIRIASYARIIGTDGDIMLNTGGGGTQLAPGERDALISMLSWPGMSDIERMAIMRRLGWHRGENQADGGIAVP